MLVLIDSRSVVDSTLKYETGKNTNMDLNTTIKNDQISEGEIEIIINKYSLVDIAASQHEANEMLEGNKRIKFSISDEFNNGSVMKAHLEVSDTEQINLKISFTSGICSSEIMSSFKVDLGSLPFPLPVG